MKLKTKVLSLLMTLALVIGLMTPVQAKAEEASDFSLSSVQGKTVILHTNDTHGRIDRGMDGSLGITAVAAFKKVLEQEGAQVILLDAGDTLHGKPIATIDQGETIVKVMNASGYDAMTLGNHDFNYGSDRLRALTKEMEFPVLSANVTNDKDGTPFVSNHMIIEKNGVKFGIFGLSTLETVTKTNPKNVSDLQFYDPIETAQFEVSELEAEGADVIIALGHIGIDESSDPTSADILSKVDGIDLFIDGHSHSTLAACITANQTESLLVSTGQYLNAIGMVVIDNDQTMKAYSLTTDDLAKAGVKTVLAENETEATIEEEVGTILIKANDKLSTSLKEVVATTEVALDGLRENVRTKETNLGNLAADAIRWAAGTDVAMTNGGGIRTSIAVGDITKGMLAEVFPFGNIVVSKEVTGQAIKDMLEHGVKDYPATSGGYPQISGMTFNMDPAQPAGSRISNLKINGKAIDLTATYTLASNDFTIAGGDGYTMIGDEFFPTLYEFGALDEVLISYLSTNPSVESFAVGRTTMLPASEVAVEEEKAPVIEEEVKDDVKEEPTEEVTQRIYTVKKGDFLRKIAKTLFGNEAAWKNIYQWNKNLIKDPNLIQIGWELLILE